MSSNRIPMPCQAVVSHRQRPVGPLLMPLLAPESFIEEFNRTYRSIGLSVSITETPRPLAASPKGLHSHG